VTRPDDSSRDAVVDLLGLLACGELLAFQRMADDARLAPDLHRRAVLSEMAAAEIGNYRRLAARLDELDALPAGAMQPYVTALDEYHDKTEPNDWLEALVKAYVGNGIADDFFREIARLLSADDRDLVLDVLHDAEKVKFVVGEIRTAIEADPRARSRLSMWARRLVGEGLWQAQRVAAERESLLGLIAAADDGPAADDLFQRLTAAHTERMATLGLNN
jgi:tRNA-(MS[2]IO[6]A)-hydroxylase (MiaE)-like